VLITSHLTLNLPSRFPLLAANDYLADDVNKFADLAAAPQMVGVLSQATIEQPVQGPGLVLLDRHGQVESLTPAARHWLDRLGQDPPVLSAVAASAQASGPARARVRTPAGQWLILHGARLDGDPQARVSVVIEPPRPDELAPLLVAAYGLSDREQTVAALVFQGRSTRQIARALSISPCTVQEHLTAIFDKVGVRSRGELVGQVFFRQSLPDIPD
jgi:DNA-binding CsgD family transcriptional regulator